MEHQPDAELAHVLAFLQAHGYEDAVNAVLAQQTSRGAQQLIR
jgi:hypothetical protein